MSGIAYWYFVAYEPDAQSALDKLRVREFESGRYYPAVDEPVFSEPGFSAQRPSKSFPSVAAAIRAAGEAGTRSILDVERVGDDRPRARMASRLGDDDLARIFGTTQPTHAQVKLADELFDLIDRGRCVFLVVFEQGAPSEYYFAGYSWD